MIELVGGAMLLRALPLALCLPLPGLWPRVALGLVLALAAGERSGGEPSLPSELALGLALGMGATLPVWAARWAGAVVGVTLGRGRQLLPVTYQVIAWIAFCAARGPSLLVAAYLESYRRWPVGMAPLSQPVSLGQAGAEALELATRLALPSLLAIALVELCAGVAQRLEGTARSPFDARALALAIRPVLVALLLVASLAAFSQSVLVAVH